MKEYVEYRDELATSDGETPVGLDYDQFVKALEEAKQHLSPRQREIFELNKEYGLSITEISRKLSITEQVVRNQLSIALKTLRAELRPFYALFLLFLS